jgi:hypothetical protein
LRAHGFDAAHAQDGFPQWQAAGLKVETSA